MAEYKSKHTGAVIDASVDRVNDGGSLPDYWKTHIDARIIDTRSVLESAGWNKSAFLWYNDAHWTYSYQCSPEILKYLYKHTPINKTNFGGDICDQESTDRADMTYLWDWRKAIRSLPNHHSVIGNHDDGNGSNNVSDGSFPVGYTYSWLLAAEETPDVVRGDKFYYYIDNPSEKTRYLYLDTASKNYNILNNTAQQEFVKEALKSTPDGWHIVAIAHIWRDMDYSTTPPTDNDWSWGARTCLPMFHAYNTRNGEYASCGGKVEFCIGGHSHIDSSWLYEGAIPVILTECESRHVRSGLSYTEGTINESAVSAVIADYNSHKIHVIRIGRGESFVVDIPTSGQTSYTNVLPLAIDVDGSIYNASDTPGYKANTRLSSSNAYAETTQTGIYTTGFIPVKLGDQIRLKNVQVISTTSYGEYAGCIYYSTNNAESITVDTTFPSGTEHVNDAQFDENGYLTSFRVGNGDLGGDGSANYLNGYMRISAQYIGADSIITVNEAIV